jgi:hypothetical protein
MKHNQVASHSPNFKRISVPIAIGTPTHNPNPLARNDVLIRELSSLQCIKRIAFGSEYYGNLSIPYVIARHKTREKGAQNDMTMKITNNKIQISNKFQILII